MDRVLPDSQGPPSTRMPEGQPDSETAWVDPIRIPSLKASLTGLQDPPRATNWASRCGSLSSLQFSNCRPGNGLFFCSAMSWDGQPTKQPCSSEGRLHRSIAHCSARAAHWGSVIPKTRPGRIHSRMNGSLLDLEEDSIVSLTKFVAPLGPKIFRSSGCRWSCRRTPSNR